MIHEGGRRSTDQLIYLTHKVFCRKVIWGRTQGEEGTRLTRAAFACLLHFGGILGDFETLTAQVETDSEKHKALPAEDLEKCLIDGLAANSAFERVYKRWEKANSMR